MKKNQDIPAHYYNEAVGNVQRVHGKPLLSLDPQFPFALTRFEFMNSLGQADYPHRHDYYEVLYICAGEGTHIIDFESYSIQPPVFHFLSKGQVHFWQLSKPLQGYALLFPEEFLGFPSSNSIRAHDFALFHTVGHAPYLSVGQEHRTMVSGLLEGMEQEFHSKTARSLTVLRAYLHILLTKLHRLYIADQPDENSQATSSLVRQFKQLVSDHFLTEHSVQEYAGRIGISTSHLRDTVKANTGYAPGHFIREKLALEAKRLLAHSDETVAEIGYRLNFEDASYFGRFFKRETGMSPNAFRRQIRQQYRMVQE
jgi:AraC-like DNA-binding protein/quercetin dioxygenase-like cupin family protein